MLKQYLVDASESTNALMLFRSRAFKSSAIKFSAIKISSFRFNSYLVLLLLISISLMSSGINAKEREPIAIVGHGMMFDHQGKHIEPSLEFLVEAQAWYEGKLFDHLPDEIKNQYKKYELDLIQSIDTNTLESLALKHDLMEWTFKQNVKNADTRNIITKLRVIDDQANKIALAEGSDSTKRNTRNADQIAAVKKMLDQLNLASPTALNGPLESSIMLATTNSGQAYINECSAAQVPIPPSINQMDPAGLNGWRSEGFIPDSENFLNAGPAELRSYRSNSPAGMCYSLPRFTNDSLTTIGLDGVICMSETTSRVCFWDNIWTNPNNGNIEAFTIAPGEIVPIGVPSVPGGKYQAGGAELEFASGGECTDCHAGENPFIVHPKTGLLDAPSNNGGSLVQYWEDLVTPTGDLDHFSANRYVPLVAASWWQNEASMQGTAIPATCNGCHIKGSEGRLPHLSNLINGYCNVVLPRARDLTMPPWSPGSQDAAINALMANYCNLAPDASVADTGDPHITTVDGTRYDFQSAGEFTMLRMLDEGFELQTRQSPVLTTFTPSPNHHTGLASCPSLNTAVGIRAGKSVISYQPIEGVFANKEDLQLIVNGKIIYERGTISLGSGHSLQWDGPGEGLYVYLSDGSIVRVEPKFWTSQGYWYLNIHVDDTFAREGVMGLITKGDWLPRLSDGSSLGSKPASLMDRHVILNSKFADDWRVNAGNSLFYYPGGTTTADFTDVNWPAPPGGSCEGTSISGNIPMVKEPRWELAKEVCSKINDPVIREDCMLDVAVLGDEEAARVHIEADAQL